MKSAYRVLALLIAALVFVQAGSIAWGTFIMLRELDDGNVPAPATDPNVAQVLHGTTGVMVIPAVALILLIVSFFAKIPGAAKWAAIVFALVVVQVALGFVSFGAPVVGALHGMNALAIVGTSLNAASRTRTTAPHDASGAETPAEYAETKARARRLGRGRQTV